ncbi:hypothetical protein KIL84_011844 [Mauremys mutica]|uniref:Uncharacterized protein n=1 Tax=Mauremys mutica TaxID=74926 RepID=A0A9D3XEF6_9SAUR|nr:hypothetical protein KIL84_011844 [Mauremys mutica]
MYCTGVKMICTLVQHLHMRSLHQVSYSIVKNPCKQALSEEAGKNVTTDYDKCFPPEGHLQLLIVVITEDYVQACFRDTCFSKYNEAAEWTNHTKLMEDHWEEESAALLNFWRGKNQCRSQSGEPTT